MIKLSKSKAISRIISFLVLLVLVFGTGLSMNGLQVKAAAVTSTYIEDDADIFTDNEEEMLIKEMKKIQNAYDVDVVILTVDDRGSISATNYIDDYYDSHYKAGSISKNAIISLRDINDRWIELGTYGKALSYITDSRVDAILDDMTSELRQDQYYNAYSIFLKDIETYLELNPNPLTWTWVQGLIGLALGAIITAIMVSHSKGRITTNSHTYLDEANSGLVAKRDMYITTTVRRIHRPQASSGSGGGNRRTAGGHSAGGGGRRI